MPGRFPLSPVPLTNDPFCEDAYCGDPIVTCPLVPWNSAPNLYVVFTAPQSVITSWSYTWSTVLRSCSTGAIVSSTTSSFSGGPITDTNVVGIQYGLPPATGGTRECGEAALNIPVGAGNILFTQANGNVIGRGSITAVGSLDPPNSVTVTLLTYNISVTDLNGTPILPSSCNDFDPFAYAYVDYVCTRRYGGPTLPITNTAFGSKRATSTINGYRTSPAFMGPSATYVSPNSLQGLWAMSGTVYQVSSASGGVFLFHNVLEFSDGSTVLQNAAVSGGVSYDYAPYPTVIGTLETTFRFYDSPTGPVVATWPGYRFN